MNDGVDGVVFQQGVNEGAIAGVFSPFLVLVKTSYNQFILMT
jgi:hypothetical protein